MFSRLTRTITGFSDKKDSKHYSVKDEKGKLTIAEMNRFVLAAISTYMNVLADD